MTRARLADLLGVPHRPDGPLRELIRRRLQHQAEAEGLGIDAEGSHEEAFDFVPPPGVEVLRDMAYGDHPAQRLDLYRPQAARGAPLIVYVHGGAWQRGDKAMPQMVRHKAAHYTARGALFASINYRMLPEADVLQQADDLCRALAFAQAQAASWGAAADRIALIGHSAGAHLAALVAADPAIAARFELRRWRATIALDSAALDMVAIMNRPHFRFYDPVFGDDPAYWRQASPTWRLQGAPVTPMLLVCSSRRLDSRPPAEAFAEKARRFGGRVEVLPVDLTHREINDTLGTPGDYTAAVDAFLQSAGIELRTPSASRSG